MSMLCQIRRRHLTAACSGRRLAPPLMLSVSSILQSRSSPSSMTKGNTANLSDLTDSPRSALFQPDLVTSCLYSSREPSRHVGCPQGHASSTAGRRAVGRGSPSRVYARGGVEMGLGAGGLLGGQDGISW